MTLSFHLKEKKMQINTFRLLNLHTFNLETWFYFQNANMYLVAWTLDKYSMNSNPNPESYFCPKNKVL